MISSSTSADSLSTVLSSYAKIDTDTSPVVSRKRLRTCGSINCLTIDPIANLRSPESSEVINSTGHLILRH